MHSRWMTRVEAVQNQYVSFSERGKMRRPGLTSTTRNGPHEHLQHSMDLAFACLPGINKVSKKLRLCGLGATKILVRVGTVKNGDYHITDWRLLGGTIWPPGLDDFQFCYGDLYESNATTSRGKSHYSGTYTGTNESRVFCHFSTSSPLRRFSIGLDETLLMNCLGPAQSQDPLRTLFSSSVP